jgi:hypothetical protein
VVFHHHLLLLSKITDLNITPIIHTIDLRISQLEVLERVINLITLKIIPFRKIKKITKIMVSFKIRWQIMLIIELKRLL